MNANLLAAHTLGADDAYVSRMTHALTDIDRARRCNSSAAHERPAGLLPTGHSSDTTPTS
eukprot:958166-Pleurochrysis_carterae.AAC.1